eukprot:8809484-Pyramimonas_sp.AAC.1
MILRHAGPEQLEVGIDGQALISVWSRGCLQDCADLSFGEFWHEVFALLSGRGPDAVESFKDPAHKSSAQAAALGCPAWAWRGNRAVYSLSKKAASELPHSRRPQELGARQAVRPASLARFTARVLGQCAVRRFPDVQACKAMPRAKPEGLLIVPSPN